ncbi:hypothetical protein HML84_20405 [Alcanivorax sp. IO_7]|nr:hypothetical protein HML84_20405 [Alcanivorax sp. IO_7]
MSVSEARQAAIHALWDELAELPASRPDTALDCLLNRIAGLIDSDHGYWLCSIRLSDDANDPCSAGVPARSASSASCRRINRSTWPP